MANFDRQFSVTGTGSLVCQEFGGWSDSQVIRVSGATATISFDGTNTITMLAGEGIEWSNHRRCKVYVSGVGATVNVIVSAAAEN
jgi:hypothetical protein